MTDAKMGICPNCGGVLEFKVPEKCSLSGVDAYKCACYCSCGYKFEVFAETTDECFRVMYDKQFKPISKQLKTDTKSFFIPTRKSILDEAAKCVCGDRDQQYGGPETSFRMIAELWEPYIRQKCVSAGADVTISAEDVAAMMALFKMARVATGSYKADSWIDAAGYSASGGEIAGGKQ